LRTAYYDPALFGRIFEAGKSVLVTEEMIADFCRAIGETNPVYVDLDSARAAHGAVVAPPSLAATFRGGDNIFQHIHRYGSEGLAAGMDVEFIAPIRAGDSITMQSQLTQSYEKTGRSGPMIFVVIRTTLKNQRGETVAHIDHRFMNRP
jgi:acyl dehydratase